MKKAIFFLALTLIVGESIAQNLSQYEQKRYDLAAQTATEIVMEVPELAITLGMSVKKTDFTNKYEEMDFFEGLIQSVGVFAVYNSNADYQSYKVKEIYKTWIEKRRVIDKTKTKADEQRENERKKKTEETLPERGTKALLLYSVKKDFEKWAVKGEFEKTDELMERMRILGPHIFDSICLLYTCGKWSVALSTEAVDYNLKYDADEEVYRMEFTYGGRDNPQTIIGKASVPIVYARDGRTRRPAVSSLRIVNNQIIPKEFQINYYMPEAPDEEYPAKFHFDSIPGEKPLIVCFSELGFTGNVPIELLSHCMNPSEYLKAEERETFVKDSIAKRERFVRDSIKKRELFVKDSIERRERFVSDSIAKRERFVRDSINQRNEEIRKSNNRYYDWLTSFEKHIERYFSYRGLAHRLINMDGKIKKCSFEEKVLILKCGKKKYSGIFAANNVKNDMGLIYQTTNGRNVIRNIVANEDGSLVIYQYIDSREGCIFVFLIDKNTSEIYEINDSVQKKLKEAGLIK